MDWLRRMFWVTMCNNIKIVPEYVPSENITAADSLSRLPYSNRVAEIIEKLASYDICCYDMLINVLDSRVNFPEEGGEILPWTVGGTFNQAVKEISVEVL